MAYPLKQENNLNIEYLAKCQWHYIHKRFRSPFYTYLLWEGLRYHYNEELLFAYEMPGILYLDQELMFLKNVWDKKQKEVLKELNNNPDFINGIFKKSYALDKKIVSLTKLINKQTSLNLSNDQLLNYFKKYLSLSLSASAFMIFPLFIEGFLEKEILKAVKKSYKNSAEVMQNLTTLQKLSSTQQEEISLLKIAIKKLHNKNLDKEIETHIKNYAWLKNSALTGDFYIETEVALKIKKISPAEASRKLKVIAQDHKNLQAAISTYCQKIDNQQITKFIEILQEAIYFRSWRTERYYRNAQYLESFFFKIAKKINLKNPKDIFFLLPTEIISALTSEQKIDRKIISTRKQGYLMFADKKGIQIFSDETAPKATKKIKFTDYTVDTKDITGQIAFPGKVRGRARIIKSSKDFPLFKKGEILISHSTTPNYMPIIKLAAAIITDEGGVLSHASVISREMQIPCIIGTRLATKKLHNGDLIEVDAQAGIIKKIK